MTTTYSFTCSITGESQDIVVCEACAVGMPPVDGERVQAHPADDDVDCEMCPGLILGPEYRP